MSVLLLRHGDVTPRASLIRGITIGNFESGIFKQGLNGKCINLLGIAPGNISGGVLGGNAAFAIHETEPVDAYTITPGCKLKGYTIGTGCAKQACTRYCSFCLKLYKVTEKNSYFCTINGALCEFYDYYLRLI